jgi:hypothetical protein
LSTPCKKICTVFSTLDHQHPVTKHKRKAHTRKAEGRADASTKNTPKKNHKRMKDNQHKPQRASHSLHYTTQRTQQRTCLSRPQIRGQIQPNRAQIRGQIQPNTRGEPINTADTKADTPDTATSSIWPLVASSYLRICSCIFHCLSWKEAPPFLPHSQSYRESISSSLLSSKSKSKAVFVCRCGLRFTLRHSERKTQTGSSRARLHHPPTKAKMKGARLEHPW